jgi:ATP synthase protein I
VIVRAVAAEDVSPMPDPADKRGPGERQMTAEEKAAFEGRISDLGGRLDKVKANRQADAQADLDAEMRGRGMAYGMRMAAELVGAVIVGGAIGWGLDKWLGSTPWLFLLFFVLGFAAGVLNVVRAYERMQKDIMSRTGGNIGHSVPDDED